LQHCLAHLLEIFTLGQGVALRGQLAANGAKEVGRRRCILDGQVSELPFVLFRALFGIPPFRLSAEPAELGFSSFLSGSTVRTSSLWHKKCHDGGSCSSAARTPYPSGWASSTLVYCSTSCRWLLITWPAVCVAVRLGFLLMAGKTRIDSTNSGCMFIRLSFLSRTQFCSYIYEGVRRMGITTL
jgi:hypothetical protein